MNIIFVNNAINISETSDIVLFSIAGQEIKSIRQANSLSMANLPKGVYIVKAGTQSKGYQIQKLMLN